uniref:BPTI/Kunitz inhibitor domain-containing protein n=1 Tax=Stegastes partitus TaxID=144197 RepID=A0A3B5AED7_9TELE
CLHGGRLLLLLTLTLVILDPGPCREYVVKWYYDATANGCAQFWFGGCLGNDNQFETEKSCRETCVKDSPPKRSTKGR